MLSIKSVICFLILPWMLLQSTGGHDTLSTIKESVLNKNVNIFEMSDNIVYIAYIFLLNGIILYLTSLTEAVVGLKFLVKIPFHLNQLFDNTNLYIVCMLIRPNSFLTYRISIFDLVSLFSFILSISACWFFVEKYSITIITESYDFRLWYFHILLSIIKLQINKLRSNILRS